MALTDTQIRNAKHGPKALKLFDGGGLFLLLSPNGGKWWRLKYRFGGKEKLLSLGVYPDVGLKVARIRREEARSLLTNGVDPSEHRKASKRAERAITEDTFEAVAREWYAKMRPRWVASHADKIIRRFEKDLFPWIGTRPVGEVTAPELLAVLRRIEERGALDTAHRAHQNCGQVFRYAVATGRAERDTAADLRGALPPAKATHYPTITGRKEIADLLRSIEGYGGSMVTRCALTLGLLTFVRPGELRRAEWSEFDLEHAEWRIPAHKMKSRALHAVPLSGQSLAVLRELHPLTGHGRYLFPSERTGDRPMSENTVNGALRRLGYSKQELTGHSFRSVASTLLNENGWNRDAIERQLAHAERDEVRAAYNHAEHLPERRKMMAWWANHLDQLKAGAKIIPIGRSAS